MRKFKVYLSAEHRRRLEAVVHPGRAAAKARFHAQVLLLADEEPPQGRWHDEQIGQALGLHRTTMSRVRKRFVLGGEPVRQALKKTSSNPGNSTGSAFRSGMRRASSPRWKRSSTSISPPRATRSR